MHAALALEIDRRRTAHLNLFPGLRNQPNWTGLLCNQHPAIGQKRHPPGQLKRGHLGHGKGQVRFRLLFAHIDLRPSRYRRKNEQQPRFTLCDQHSSSFSQRAILSDARRQI